MAGLFGKVTPATILPRAALCNSPQYLTAETPSAGVLTARGIAKLYAALIGAVDGVRLVRPERVAEITGPVFTGQDELMGNDVSWAMGYGIGRLGSTGAQSPTTFGMPGMGGSAAWADTRAGVAFGLTRTLFDPAQSNPASRSATWLRKLFAEIPLCVRAFQQLYALRTDWWSTQTR
ncbi:hypothetical protein AB0F43_10180 [Kribbella sp. NPDC023972]|uniref:hypothetical protein n=1 Tax=Kribbella sp. NPDC023972 TaxID=3154795 RepID=UPI0033F48AB8